MPPTPTPIPPPLAPVLTAPDDGNSFPEGSTIGLDWTGAGPGLEYIAEVDGGPSGSGSFGPQGGSSQEIGPLPAGYVYTWRVKARGPGGDGPWSEPREFTVRLAPPTGVQAAVLSCTEVRLTWRDNSASEDGYRVSRDGVLIGQTGAEETAFVARALAGGTSHAFTVHTQRGDHQSPVSSVATIETPPCDTTPPSGSWLAPADSATIRQGLLVLDASAQDDSSGVDRVVLRGRWGADWRDVATLTAPPYRHAWDLCAAGIPDGPVDLRLRIVDRAGNETTETIGVLKRVNCAANQPPDTPRIASPDQASRVVGSVPIAVVAGDSYDTPQELRVQVRIDDGAWVDAGFDTQSGRYVAAWDSTGSADGSHAVRARATDGGSLTATSDPVTVTVDNIDESPIADAGPDRTIPDTDESGAEAVTFDAGASTHDPQRTATYAWEDRWDNRPPVSLGSGEQIATTLGLGTHVVTMTITDSLGNRDDDQAIISVIPPPDTVPPTAAWMSPASGEEIDTGTATLRASFSDSGGSGFKEIVFRGRWGGAWRILATIANSHSPVVFRWDLCDAGVPDGDIELGVRAVDNAGNQFDAPTRVVSKRFTCTPVAPSLDLSPPEGARGDVVRIAASGFAAGETVTATLVHEQKAKPKKGKPGQKGKGGKNTKGKKGNSRARGQPDPRVMTLDTEAATSAGTATLTFTVPADAPLGRHRLDVTGAKGSRASAPFTVLAGAPRTTAAEPESGPGGAADEPGDATDPAAPANRGPDQALLPPESGSTAAGSPKRKPGKSRDRPGRDDKNDTGKHKHKRTPARVGDRRTGRQRR